MREMSYIVEHGLAVRGMYRPKEGVLAALGTGERAL
jgi:hypothetical protein